VQITPIDINKQEFKKVMRGYDPVEVDTFLEMIGKEYEALINQNKMSEKRVMQLEAELKNFKEVERTLKQTLLNLQENSDKTRANSKKEAELIRKEAEVQAVEMIDKARRESQKMKDELIKMKSQKDSLVARLRQILSSHLELLDLLDTDENEISKLKDRSKKVFSGSKKSINESKFSLDSETSVNNFKEEPKIGKKVDDQINESNLFKNIFGENLD